MTREVILDTETTGLDPKSGHRIIEIGCIELIDRLPTGNTYHQYINPERPVDEGAVRVHGITDDFLRDKPFFHEIYDAFFNFMNGAALVIHNASFDCGFIDHEFKLLNTKHKPIREYCEIIDTLQLARELHPGQRNNLDALCKRYNIDNSSRHYHGALLDAEILAKVYLRMTGGQENLFVSDTKQSSREAVHLVQVERIETQHQLLVQKANDAELSAHQAYLDYLQEKSGEAQEAW